MTGKYCGSLIPFRPIINGWYSSVDCHNYSKTQRYKNAFENNDIILIKKLTQFEQYWIIFWTVYLKTRNIQLIIFDLSTSVVDYNFFSHYKERIRRRDFSQSFSGKNDKLSDRYSNFHLDWIKSAFNELVLRIGWEVAVSFIRLYFSKKCALFYIYIQFDWARKSVDWEINIRVPKSKKSTWGLLCMGGLGLGWKYMSKLGEQ